MLLKSLIFVLFISACYHLPFEAAESTRNIFAAQHISTGNSFAKSGNYQAALSELTTAIAVDPENARAYKLRGHVYYVLGDYTKSLADLDYVVALTPTSANAYCDRAIANSAAGNHGQALVDIDQALKIQPESVFALSVRKVVLEKAAQ